MLGTVIDKYEVLQKVGEGGMATVYRARHVTLDREVAIKVLHPHLSASSRNRQRFAREARAIEHLDHDNILKIYDYSGVDVEDCYIVTEFVRGRTLLALLDARGLLPSEVAALIGLRLAEALSYAHTTGIIHRDLKPENVMLRDDGVVKLMDFGIARFLDESTVTMTGSLVGSPAYMSPEQALERPVDPRSDLFSLGTMLYHLVTGQLPFSGSNPSVILRNIIDGRRSEVLELQPGASPHLADVIERLLQVDPDGRYANAGELSAALRQSLDESEIDPDGATWSLTAYLADPDDYEGRLSDHLDEVLLRRGRSAFSVGDHLRAQRLLNRLLVQEPDHPEVLELLTSLHQPEPDDEQRGRLGQLAAAVVLLLLLSGLAWTQLSPSPPPSPAPLPLEQPAAVDEPAVEPVMEANDLDDDLENHLNNDLAAEAPAGELVEEPVEATSPADRVAAPAPGAGPPLKSPDPRVGRRAEPKVAPPQPKDVTEQASLTVRITNVSWADAYLDGQQLPKQVRQPLELELAPGPHVLLLQNFFVEDFVYPFDAVAGENTLVEATLVKLPIVVRVRDSLSPACVVTVDGERRGSLSELGWTFKLQDPDNSHMISLECPDAEVQHYTVASGDPNSQVVLPPSP